MTKNDISKMRHKLTNYLESGRLYDAFKLVRRLSEQNMSWELTDKIDNLEKSYS